MLLTKYTGMSLSKFADEVHRGATGNTPSAKEQPYGIHDSDGKLLYEALKKAEIHHLSHSNHTRPTCVT